MDSRSREKKVYYKVQPEGDESYCIISDYCLGDAIKSWLEGAEIGTVVLRISTIEMTDEEVEKLPEYEG